MRSLQAIDRNYSELQVLYSPAGWYLGTVYRDSGATSMGSRDSCYFSCKTDAVFALELCERMYAECLRQRTKHAGEAALEDKAFARDFGAVLYMCGLDSQATGYRLSP